MEEVEDIQLDWESFRNKIKRINDSRVHKISGSKGIYDAYKWIRKNKWFDIGRPLTEHEFYSIIRTINQYFAEELIQGNDVILPHRLGKIELRENPRKVFIKDGKVITNMSVDWNATLMLWYQDEESYKKKTLVKMEDKAFYTFHYNKHKANYNNKSFFDFAVNRDIKLRLKRNIRNGKFQGAFTYKYN